MRRGQVLRSTGNEKRMRRHIFAMMAVALVIGTTQNPAAHAQGNMTPSGSALSAPATQVEHSPANAAMPSRTNDASATPPPPGEPAIGIAELPQDSFAVGHVSSCRSDREGGDDRACDCFVGDVDYLVRKRLRIAEGARRGPARPALAGELPNALSGARATPQWHEPNRTVC